MQKKMIIDFRRNKTVIPPREIWNNVFKIENSYKLLGLWVNDDFIWNTNTDYIVKKAANRLYFLKVLKSYHAPKKDLKAFYTSVVRSTL